MRRKYDSNGALITSLPSLPASSLVGQVPLANGGTAVDNTSRTANTVFAGPSTGSPGNASFRALVAADIPNLPGSIITSGTVAVARLGSGSSSAETVLFGSGAWARPGKINWIPKTELGANATNIPISSFPTYGTFYNLRIIFTLRSDKSAALENCRIQFNNDTTAANYLTSYLYAQASGSAVAGGSITAVGILVPVSVVSNTGLANTFSTVVVDIPLWGATGRNHEIEVYGGLSSGTALADLWNFHTHGTWKNTANPITSIKIVPDTGTNFVTGSSVEMWAA